MKNISSKLRASPLWRETYSVVEYIYSQLDELNTNNPDEKWATGSKLRDAANDGMFNVSQVVGSTATEINEYDLNNARKNLFTLQSMYIFATKQNLLGLEPEIVVKIDRIIEKIDVEIALSKKETKKKIKEDIEPWLEKYRLWKAMQDK